MYGFTTTQHSERVSEQPPHTYELHPAPACLGVSNPNPPHSVPPSVPLCHISACKPIHGQPGLKLHDMKLRDVQAPGYYRSSFKHVATFHDIRASAILSYECPPTADYHGAGCRPALPSQHLRPASLHCKGPSPCRTLAHTHTHKLRDTYKHTQWAQVQQKCDESFSMLVIHSWVTVVANADHFHRMRSYAC